MFTAVFDASGDERDLTIVVAGFSAEADRWIQFESAWVQRLREDGLEYFHMTDFISGRGPFAGWDQADPKSILLIRDLVGIIKSHVVRKFGCALMVRDFHYITSEQNRNTFLLHAYPTVAMHTSMQVERWYAGKNVRVDHVFEHGDEWQGAFFGRMRKEGQVVPIARRKKDRTNKRGEIEPGYVPLQAADILAHGYYSLLKWGDTVSEVSISVTNELENVPGEVVAWDREHLIRFQRRMDEESGSVITA